MSFGEKLTAIMERPGQDPVAKDDVPWWMKYAGRGVGTVGSLIAIVLGAGNCLSILAINISCLLGGIWQMVAGFLVLVIEAPCCCLFLDYIQQLSDWVDRRPYWNRAAGYCLIAVPPVFLCTGFSSLFGCGFIFGTGVIYGLMSLGKKAPIDEMRVSATTTVPPADVPSMTRSNLIQNAQPIGFSSPPDSNV